MALAHSNESLQTHGSSVSVFQGSCPFGSLQAATLHLDRFVTQRYLMMHQLTFLPYFPSTFNFVAQCFPGNKLNQTKTHILSVQAGGNFCPRFAGCKTLQGALIQENMCSCALLNHKPYR